MTIGQEKDHLVETQTHHKEVEEDLVRIIHKIIGEDCKTILGMTIEEIIIENRGIGGIVEVETNAEILIESSRDDFLET